LKIKIVVSFGNLIDESVCPSCRLWKTLSPVDSLVGMQQKSLNILYGWTILDIHIKHRENPEFLEAVEYVNNRSVKVLSDMNTPFESWKYAGCEKPCLQLTLLLVCNKSPLAFCMDELQPSSNSLLVF
jgi:hypothetical protein